MATKKRQAKRRKSSSARIRLIVSEKEAPVIQARPGIRIELVELANAEGTPARLGSRLCGYGSGYCLAILETE
jgi:hypothetical protein